MGWSIRHDLLILNAILNCVINCWFTAGSTLTCRSAQVRACISFKTHKDMSIHLKYIDNCMQEGVLTSDVFGQSLRVAPLSFSLVAPDPAPSLGVAWVRGPLAPWMWRRITASTCRGVPSVPPVWAALGGIGDVDRLVLHLLVAHPVLGCRHVWSLCRK